MLAVGAASQPHFAHASARQQPDGLPRPKAPSGGGGAGFVVGGALGIEGPNHPLGFGAQPSVAIAALVQGRPAAIFIQRADLAEELFQPPPIVVHSASECSLSYSHARAKRKCRSMVASDT